MRDFKIGEFALLQGQVVEVVDVVPLTSKHWPGEYVYKVKLLNDTLTHRVHKNQLEKTLNQLAPKVLFKTK